MKHENEKRVRQGVPNEKKYQKRDKEEVLKEAFLAGYYLRKHAPSLLRRIEKYRHEAPYREALEAGKAEAEKEMEQSKVERRNAKMEELRKRFGKERGKDELER